MKKSYYQMSQLVAKVLSASNNWQMARHIWQIEYSSADGITEDRLSRFIDTLKNRKLLDENYTLGVMD